MSQKLSKILCFLLTLMKLRLNLPNYDLEFRFCVEKEAVQKTMPWCFRPHYGLQVSSIIDCFELFVGKPGDLLCCTAMWSQCKHYNTAKYLISIAPLGTVNFVSKGYTGKASDKFTAAT